MKGLKRKTKNGGKQEKTAENRNLKKRDKKKEGRGGGIFLKILWKRTHSFNNM